MTGILLNGKTGKVRREMQRALAPLGNLSASRHTSHYVFAQAITRPKQELRRPASRAWMAAHLNPAPCQLRHLAV